MSVKGCVSVSGVKLAGKDLLPTGLPRPVVTNRPNGWSLYREGLSAIGLPLLIVS